MNFKIFVLLFVLVTLALVSAKSKKKPPCMPCQPHCPIAKGKFCPIDKCDPQFPICKATPRKARKGEKCADKGGECGKIGRCKGMNFFHKAIDCNRLYHDKDCCIWTNDESGSDE